MFMARSRSRMTSQGQVSVPAEIRRALGLAPGAVLEWEQRGDELIVRKAGRHNSADLHVALFGAQPAPKGADAREGIRAHMRRKHARG
jgi:AbrB family looped-hinge helix DNA binding protein